ncbi:M23 family metallopeptidase [Sulfurimonas sp. SWIR-19]|uniref:M23 family metallopeptidase n=1 Tax=Sulfurimonas sp. SWIR-19 TaxID=2878390 RepID=UPI001CF55B43|nr:M23 family metallopeptidase [Sulfurimonas sp. SWIR-19]UCM99865.1 M23 family metallopeptidase [Sulfurimonas sp. SWIR-19]
MKFLLFLCLFVSSLFALHVKIVNDEVGNGKTALLTFTKEKGIVYKFVKYEKQKITIFTNPFDRNRYYALIPISYYERPSQKTVQIVYTQNGTTKHKNILLHVKDAKYKKETLHVSAAKVNPQLPTVKKRIAKEYNEAMKIYNTVTWKSYMHSKFILPVQSEITSAFGTARIYNGALKGYHSGTDFRAKTGTPIRAANDGKVVLVKKRFYSGGTVIIDHGEGIYTCYFHMSKFNVKTGQLVQKGELLGLSGKSGRVTGPHLHFSARIDGVQVDPLQLIALLNNNLILNK